MTNRLSDSDHETPAELQQRYPEGYWDNGDKYLQQC